MNLLLDTHIFLWFISGDARLPILFQKEIQEPGNNVFLSVASIWEIIIKYNLGKLPLPQSPEIYIPRRWRIHRIKSLPITEASLKNLVSLPDLHRDPFDRILISQALSGNLTIVTVDPAIKNYSVPVLK
ncbi:MAG: type II toxin-antitoxin system VapC family toxin [Pyrinomonadaceae bacterium]|nr:type II toxin-antitoxin system VapC family toxin [Pyrinomonadaceae bacterium]